jgi:PqqD family protein of HPr-rel-A system
MTRPQRPRARQELSVIELDGEAVVYDRETGNLHHLNPTATVVFSLCDGTSTARQLCVDLAEVYGMPAQELEPQVRRLLRQLKASGLIETNGMVHG